MTIGTRRSIALLGLVSGLVVACGGSTSTIGDAGASGDGGGNGNGNGNGDGGGRDGGGGGDGGSGGATCDLPQEVGPCDAAIRRFWFNKATGKCEVFSYGGCQGNANNFESAAACVAACGPSSPLPCDVISCDAGTKCVYRGETAVCAAPCENEGSGCSGGSLQCACASSCPSCKDCVTVCLPK